MVDTRSAQEELADLHRAIGTIITNWAGIEDYLFMVFAATVCPKDPIALSAAFHSVINFTNKLGMVDEAFRCAFDENNIKEWEQLHSRILTCYKVRNKIAHYMSVTESRKVKGEQRNYTILRPAIYNMAAATKDERARKNMTKYSLVDLHSISHRLLKLFGDLSDFAHALALCRDSGIPPAYFGK